MSAPRPVAPVVGMEFDDWDGDRCTVHKVKGSALSVNVLRSDYRYTVFRHGWDKYVASGSIRPVLWTVGPGKGETWEESFVILTDDDQRLGIARVADDYWLSSLHKSWRGSANYMVMAYPTRAAALAAGRAFGWTRPVARRVVRR